MRFFWNKPKPAPAEPESAREPAVIGKYFFSDEADNDGQFKIWSVSRVMAGSCDGVNGYIFMAWNREQAEKIVALLDAAVEREVEKKTEKPS